jgi:hypothetical protein
VSSTMPPSGSQPDGQPEYLDQGSGELLPKDPAASAATRKRMLIGGGAAIGVLGVGAAAFAAYSFLTTGPQPAEALPASTIAYASIDLDPSGGQKIEAIRTLNKFPAFKDELDLDTDDDLRKSFFEDAFADCDAVDYDDDIAPWIGNRAAVAAVDLGEDVPAAAGVIQVTDADAAEDGLAALAECESGSNEGGIGEVDPTDSTGWVIEGDWAVIAETEEIAQDIVDATADGTLADDATYQRWTDEVGDPGIFHAYVAPEAAQVLAEEMGGMFFPGAMMMGESMMTGVSEDDFSEEFSEQETEIPEELQKAIDDFGGLAATVRFDDGALELEVAGDSGVEQTSFFGNTGGDAALGTLPEDTLVAFGMGFEEGWLEDALDRMAAYGGGGMSVDEMLAELEQQTGLDADDVETLAGESAALALGSDFDVDTFFGSSDGSDIPVALKVKGDATAIEGVLEELRATLPEGEQAIFGSESDGDFVAVGPNADYLSEAVGDGGLRDTDLFQNVVRESEDASAILFVNFNAGDWLTEIAQDDAELSENLEPLQGFGMSAWQEDDASHTVLRLTTD